jgi:hypothetical protein
VATSVLIAFGALQEASPASAAWVTFVGAAAALATAISSIDSQPGTTGLVSRRTSRAFAAAIVAFIIVPAIVVSLLSVRARMAWGEAQSTPTAPWAPIDVPQTPGEATIFGRDFDSLPARFRFEVVESSAKVSATISAQRGHRPALRMMRQVEKEWLAVSASSHVERPNTWKLESFVQPGSYVLVAEPRDSRASAYTPYRDSRLRIRLTAVLPLVVAAVEQALGTAGPERYRLELQLLPAQESNKSAAGRGIAVPPSPFVR